MIEGVRKTINNRLLTVYKDKYYLCDASENTNLQYALRKDKNGKGVRSQISYGIISKSENGKLSCIELGYKSYYVEDKNGKNRAMKKVLELIKNELEIMDMAELFKGE